MRFKASKTKKEVAQMLSISRGTLRIWLNKKYYAELRNLGYERHQQILNPAQLNFLAEKIDLQD